MGASSTKQENKGEIRKCEIIELLPKDILNLIFCQLRANDLCQIARVCKRWNLIANSDITWKTLCLLEDGWKVLFNQKSWKETFIYRNKLSKALRTGQAVQWREIDPQNKRIYGLYINQSRDIIISGHWGKIINVWILSTGHLQKKITCPGVPFTFAGMGNELVVGTAQGIYFYSLDTFQLLEKQLTVSLSHSSLTDLVWIEGTNRIVYSGFKPTKIGVIDIPADKLLQPITDNPDANFLRVDVGKFKGKSVIMSGDQHSTVYIWNAMTLEIVEKFRVFEKSAQVFCVKQHAQHYFVYLNAVQNAVGLLFVYVFTNGNMEKINKIQFDHVPFAYYFSGPELLITFGVRHVVKVWNWRQGKEVAVLQTGHGHRGQNVSGVGDRDGAVIAFPKKHGTNFEFIRILHFTKE